MKLTSAKIIVLVLERKERRVVALQHITMIMFLPTNAAPAMKKFQTRALVCSILFRKTVTPR